MQINTADKSFKIFTWIILIIYMIVLTKLIIFKKSPGYFKHFVERHHSWTAIKENWRKGNTVPFRSIQLYLHTRNENTNPIGNLLGNIIGFLPLGFLMPLLFVRLRFFIWATMLVFFTSLGFETIQLISGVGVFDVDDLLLNTIGGMIGYLLFVGCRSLRLFK